MLGERERGMCRLVQDWGDSEEEGEKVDEGIEMA